MTTRLTVELVPSTCWYTNVRSHVPKAVWDRLRRRVAAEAGDRCEICGGRGRRWPVASAREAIDDADGSWMGDRQRCPYRFDAAAGRLTDEVQGRSFGGRQSGRDSDGPLLPICQRQPERTNHTWSMEPILVERAVVFADPSGVIRAWSAGAEALFGHAAAEATGKTLDLVVPPDYRDRHWAGYREAVAASDGNIDHGSFNIPALHRDGTVMRIEVRLHVVHDSRNGVTGAMAVFSSDDDSAPPLERL